MLCSRPVYGVHTVGKQLLNDRTSSQQAMPSMLPLYGNRRTAKKSAREAIAAIAEKQRKTVLSRATVPKFSFCLMTIDACFSQRCVAHYFPLIHNGRSMAFLAGNIRVFAGQRKLRLFFVIEEKSLPPFFRMASLAASNAGNGKLLFVYICVAIETAHESPGISHSARGSVCLLVALRACDDRVFTLQRKFRLFMRECDGLPRFGCMARFTSVRHCCGKLSFVHIGVACRTINSIVPVKLARTLRLHFPCFMAFCARHGEMSAAQSKF